MYRETTVAVVVPAYNEEGLVGTVIETVPDYVDRVYVVEDGSTDGTWREIRETASRVNERASGRNGFERRVVPIRHEENRGVGGAIKTGYLAAREDGIGVTAVMGGDAQMQPELLEGVIRPIVEGEADYVKGNRLLDGHYGTMPRFRYVGNRILTWLTRIASGYWSIGDPQNGYTAISLHALETAGIEDMYEFYGYCNDLLVRLNVAGLRVLDVPRPANYGEEESHISYRSYIPRVSGMLFRNFLWRLRAKHLSDGVHPVAVLYGTAGATGVAGLVRAARSDGGPLSILSRAVAALALSAVFLLGAMLLDYSHESYLDDRATVEAEASGYDGDDDDDDAAAVSAPVGQD
ncbi:glycosyltransferase family 2 protein [Haloarcula nitratireducens]|uniref:Glycosyltransferase family 2 protein n=1 Tax=Haloarcula nitratireducens TaxID=2487749 RepID=A0AAW4P816_9EURY|nr:glycosyltransferase family 2 protein [Halomicroarcula nitratireducens]MBX0294044.1 glycosyltransferase family 2 protein [Halomicroarcula nitratireducens]